MGPSLRTLGRRLIAVLLLAGVIALPSSAAAEAPETRSPGQGLVELIARAQGRHPTVTAALREREVYESKRYQAEWAWVPRGKLAGRLGPLPEISCQTGIVPRLGEDGNPALQADGSPVWIPRDSASRTERENWCLTTNTRNVHVGFSGILARIRLDIGMPLYTFGKIVAARGAARAGVSAQKEAVRGAELDIALAVTRAYWGIKLAQQLRLTLLGARRTLQRARREIERELDSGTGDATLVDLLRLKTSVATTTAELVETERLRAVARMTLALLVDIEPADVRLDDQPFAPLRRTLQPVMRYWELAQRVRPEARALAAAGRARASLTALRLSQLFPDLLLVGRLGIGTASSVDDPQLGFVADPFNFRSSGVALALEWQVDLIQQIGRYGKARAEQAELQAKSREAMLGMELQVRQAYGAVAEAAERVQLTRAGLRTARRWLIATVEQGWIGLAEPKKLRDAIGEHARRKMQYLRAIYDLNVGWVELARAVGLRAKELAPAKTPD
jgi:multidrug efflux system outer membrane protein